MWPLEVGAQWKLKKEISQIDDSTNVFLSLTALKPVTVDYPGCKSFRPILMVRCMEREFSAFVIVCAPPEAERGSSDDASVLVRLDNEEALNLTNSVSNDHRLLFFKSPLRMVAEFMQHEKLLFRYTPYRNPPVITNFSLRGLEKQFGAIAKSCEPDHALAMGMVTFSRCDEFCRSLTDDGWQEDAATRFLIQCGDECKEKNASAAVKQSLKAGVAAAKADIEKQIQQEKKEREEQELAAKIESERTAKEEEARQKEQERLVESYRLFNGCIEQCPKAVAGGQVACHKPCTEACKARNEHRCWDRCSEACAAQFEEKLAASKKCEAACESMNPLNTPSSSRPVVPTALPSTEEEKRQACERAGRSCGDICYSQDCSLKVRCGDCLEGSFCDRGKCVQAGLGTDSSRPEN